MSPLDSCLNETGVQWPFSNDLETWNEFAKIAMIENPFDFNPQTRVIFGSGSVQQLGDCLKSLGGSSVLFVTDKGLSEAGHVDHAIHLLKEQGLKVTLYDDVHVNPTTEDVDKALSVAKAATPSIDILLGFGGGSSMDCAKGVNFLLTNGGRMEHYWGVGKATKPMLPMIAVPTTSGTGSEAQSFALIAKEDSHMKMACGDKKAACRIAILDPDLTATMPKSVKAVTGIDAISHAIETYVTKPRNEMSAMFSRRAWQLLFTGFPKSLREPEDHNARAQMLWGAHLAGAAIENSMLGITHSLANPLTAHFDITHGLAIGLMLPHVIRYNSTMVKRLYGDLAEDANLCSPDHPKAGEMLASKVQELVAVAGCPVTLKECGIDYNMLPTLAEEAKQQWTVQFNPRAVDIPSLLELYQCSYNNDKYSVTERTSSHL